MKKPNMKRKAGLALAVAAAMIGLSPSATAITLTWVDGPQAGQAFSGGGIQIKAVNYDTGALYTPLPVGSALGFGVGGASGSVGAGAAALNAQQSRGSLGAVAGQNDSWGILRITNIQATASDGVLRDIYNSALSPVELTAMFWGVTDFYLAQVSAGSGLPGAGQIIDGTGLRVDIYSDPLKDFNQTPGPLGPHTVDTYPTATN